MTTTPTTENKTLDILQIKKLLPHRYPLLLVDRVLDYELGKRITAIKNVTVNEEFFQGHFPHKPVMPGVLMIEALAQTAALLSFMTMGVEPDENSVVYFVGIDSARFKRPVEPGDQLKMDVEIVRVSRGIWKYKAVGTVDGKVALEAELMCTIRSTADATQPTPPSQPAGQ
jgi:3-hydroxyacyl-[acyl-carrier-protein] dehydratase